MPVSPFFSLSSYAFKYEFDLVLPLQISISIIPTLKWWNFHLNGVLLLSFLLKLSSFLMLLLSDCVDPSYSEVELPSSIIAYLRLHCIPFLVFLAFFCTLFCYNVSICLSCLSILSLISIRDTFTLAKGVIDVFEGGKIIEVFLLISYSFLWRPEMVRRKRAKIKFWTSHNFQIFHSKNITLPRVPLKFRFLPYFELTTLSFTTRVICSNRLHFRIRIQ